jgi:CRISPR/Cas system-associated exonuclease Cas4 (RecB family)
MWRGRKIVGLKDLAKQVKKERKELTETVEQRFLKCIDKYLIERPGREHSFSIKPSGYFKCIRKVWYETLEYPSKDKPKPRNQRILDVGTQLHTYTQDTILVGIVETMKDLMQFIPKDELFPVGTKGVEFVEHDSSRVEFKIRDKRFTKVYPLSYMTDGTIEFEGIRYIFEFKTINSKDFEYLIEPKKDHMAQGAIYALSTDIRKVMFLYMNKDTQELKCYVYEYTDVHLDWAKERVATIDSHLSKLELPEKEAGEDCKWCGYKDYCETDKAATKYKKVEGFKVFKE